MHITKYNPRRAANISTGEGCELEQQAAYRQQCCNNRSASSPQARPYCPEGSEAPRTTTQSKKTSTNKVDLAAAKSKAPSTKKIGPPAAKSLQPLTETTNLKPAPKAKAANSAVPTREQTVGIAVTWNNMMEKMSKPPVLKLRKGPVPGSALKKRVITKGPTKKPSRETATEVLKKPAEEVIDDAVEKNTKDTVEETSKEAIEDVSNDAVEKGTDAVDTLTSSPDGDESLTSKDVSAVTTAKASPAKSEDTGTAESDSDPLRVEANDAIIKPEDASLTDSEIANSVLEKTQKTTGGGSTPRDHTRQPASEGSSSSSSKRKRSLGDDGPEPSKRPAFSDRNIARLRVCTPDLTS
jgi:hypothetical protein